MEWRDHGILLSVQKHGENSAIIQVLTEGHGRHSGVVRGGTSRKMSPLLQPGNELDVVWRARLVEHIGSFTVEPKRLRAGQYMVDRITLAGLTSIVAVAGIVLPEREPHPGIFSATVALLGVLDEPDWPIAYLHWEMAVLSDLGYQLDLSRCAATGSTENLCFVSPKSGAAVSRLGASGYEDRLLELPDIMKDARSGSVEQVPAALATTGHFLTNIVQSLGYSSLPPARQRFLDLISRGH